jgi:glycosyltransferase involved in cell wall biosynthesis
LNKIVFINATAATEGGALTILRQFLEGISLYSKKNIYYYIFCSLEELKVYENKNIKIVNNIKGKRWWDRIKWDLWGLKEWSKKKDIRADLIISFQNTGVKYYNDVKQLIYLHQSIPFTPEVKWSLLNKIERPFWFFEKYYKKLIRLTLKSNSYIVVQTDWMKKAVIKQFDWNTSKIEAIKPNLENIIIEKIPYISFKDSKFHIFYPANTSIYKNHILIIKAIKYIKDIRPDIYHNLIVHFTFKKNDNLNKNITLIDLIKKLDVSKHIKLEGKMSYDNVLSFYKSCNLMVFPSYIESFPLPLIEAAIFGLPILVADLPYAKEVIGDYDGVKFLDYKNAKLWAENIIDSYNKRTKYKQYSINCKTSWRDFFELIDKLLYKESSSNV